MATEKDAHLEIEQYMKIDARLDRIIKRMALIGTKSSGKSTIFRNVQAIYSIDITNKEECSQLCSNFRNIIIQQCYHNALNSCNIIEANKLYLQLKELSIENDDDLLKISSIISNLWQRSNTKKIYKLRHFYSYQYKIDDNIDYFFDNIDRIMTNQYQVTLQDWQKCKDDNDINKLLEYEWEIKENPFSIIEIPSNFNGIMSKKLWTFQHINAFLFFLPLSDYPVFTNDGISTFIQHIKLFKQFVNNEFIKDCEVILMFSKFDLFLENIKNGIPFKCFEDKYLEQLDIDTSKTSWNPKHKMPNITVQLAVPGYVRNSCGDNCLIPIDIVQTIQQFLQINMNEKEGIMDDTLLEEFSDYTIQFIQDICISQNKVRAEPIYCHVSNATDTETTQKIFWDIIGIIIRSNLKRGGLQR